MSQIVFLLGAGASKQAGAPLMREFLDVADDLRKGSLNPKESGDYDLVFAAIAELQKAHSKAQLELENIESVFAAFEMAKVMGILGSLKVEDIERLPSAMVRLIVSTLEKSIKLPIRNERVLPPKPYPKFVSLLAAILDQKLSASVITLNYDLCLDFALNWAGVPADYCLDDKPQPASLKLLKLHGSLNWATCTGCRRVVAWIMRDYLSKYRWQTWYKAASANLKVSDHMGSFSHCQGAPMGEIAIVPPTWNKIQYHEQLEHVWGAASKTLTDAESVFIIGYSLPPTDQFFRHFYALGSIGPTRLRRFWVFNPDTAVGPRFRDILGPQALPRFDYREFNFEGAVDAIARELKINLQEAVKEEADETAVAQSP